MISAGPSSTYKIAWGSATGGRTLAQRIPWLWYDYVVLRMPVPLWVLSCLIFALVYGYSILMAALAGELSHFLGDPRWLVFGILPAGTAYTLGTIPRAVERFWQNIRPWLADPDQKIAAYQAATPTVLMRFFWPIALFFSVVVGINVYVELPGNWAQDYAHPQLLASGALFGAPFVGYFFGGAASVATCGLGLFAYRLRRTLDLKPGFILLGGKAVLQPFNHLLATIWLTVALPVVVFLILDAPTSGTLFILYFAQAFPVVLLTVPSLVVPHLFMNRLLAHEKGRELSALRRELEEVAAVPTSRDVFEVLERIHRHQHLVYQIQKAEGFTPTLVDMRLLLQIATSIAGILLANILLRSVVARLF